MEKKDAERRLADLRMDDLPIMQFQPRPNSLSSDWFKEYKKACKEFIQGLSDSVQELAMLNLSQDEFIGLLMGTSIPNNLSIRFRIPILWGGKIDSENMFMCKTFPHSYNMDRFIIEQSEKPIIWLPKQAKKIYIPAHTASGGDGGNATEDRLSQIAAQLAAGRGME